MTLPTNYATRDYAIYLRYEYMRTTEVNKR